jgi:hypothetical protein
MSKLIHWRLINRLLAHLSQQLQQGKQQTPRGNMAISKSTSRRKIRRGRRPGKSRILTDTPEKNKTEELQTKK